MKDASLEHRWNWSFGPCCEFTMVLAGLELAVLSDARTSSVAHPWLGSLGQDCLAWCVHVPRVRRGALISVWASGPCHNAEIMSLLLSAHSTSSLRWLASSSRQNLPRLKWMCHHLPQQIQSPLMMGQTPLA